MKIRSVIFCSDGLGGWVVHFSRPGWKYAVTATPDMAMHCRDEAFLSAPIESVFEVISDLRTYAKWWLLVHVVPLDSHKLVAGTRWRFQSGPGRRPINWIAEVLEVESPRRIEMEYVEGDLLGRTAWELEACEGRTRVAYVYRGVSGVHPQTAATFARYGTQLHSLAMQTDALAKLGRYLGGEILGEERRAEVEAVVQAGVAGLN